MSLLKAPVLFVRNEETGYVYYDRPIVEPREEASKGCHVAHMGRNVRFELESMTK